MITRSVTTLPADTPFDEVFDTFIRAGRPLVLSGAALGWPCLRRWTPELFQERYGHVMVDFCEVMSGARVQRPIRDYFALRDEERPLWYLCDWDFRRKHPELLDDISVPPQLDIDWVSEIPASQRPDLLWIYIGHAGTRGPTHVDNFGTSAWLAVVEGVKRVRFASAGEGSPSNLSKLNLFDEQLDAKVELLEARLTPGDVLYVPAGMWHAAANDTYCVSVTGNFVDGANFGLHRRFSVRGWHGRRMLVHKLHCVRDMPPGAPRHRLSRHLALAIDDLRAELERELREVDSFSSFLSALGAER